MISWERSIGNSDRVKMQGRHFRNPSIFFLIQAFGQQAHGLRSSRRWVRDSSSVGVGTQRPEDGSAGGGIEDPKRDRVCESFRRSRRTIGFSLRLSNYCEDIVKYLQVDRNVL